MHRSDSLYIGVVFLMFIVTVSLFALLGPSAMTGISDEPSRITAAPAYNYGVSGERYTVNPDKFYQFCIGLNCIPALSEDQTEYEDVATADDRLKPSDMVASITVNGEAVAYPLSVLQHHFVVNTDFNGESFVVTYAPHAAYSAAFSRQIEVENVAQNTSFAFTGKLLNGDIVMQDTTGTLWNPYKGEAVRGELVPTTLQRIDTKTIRWSLWKQTHPNGSVLSPHTGVHNVSQYKDDPYFMYRSSLSVPVSAYDSDRLHPKDLVYGVASGEEATAYREVYIKDHELVQDTVGNTPVVLVQDEKTGYIHGYERRVEGSKLEFTLNPEGTHLESEDGTLWTLQGNAVSGPLQGTELEPVRLARMYWFAWQQFNPDTQIHQP